MGSAGRQTVIQKRCQLVVNALKQGARVTFKYKSGVSKAHDTYGQISCSMYAYIDGTELGKVASAVGVSYDLKATCFIMFTEETFAVALKRAQSIHNSHLVTVESDGRVSLYKGLNSEKDFQTIYRAIGLRYDEIYNYFTGETSRSLIK